MPSGTSSKRLRNVPIKNLAPHDLRRTCARSCQLARGEFDQIQFLLELLAYPRRSRFDRVGINNRLAGHVITEHLLKLGSRRIAFVNRPNSAETVWHWRAGYADALNSYEVDADPQFLFEGDPTDSRFANSIVKSGVEACVGANDMTSATLMHTLDNLGVNIPEDLRNVGMDDVRYASLLRVPLTTIHQPCKHIGMSAVTAMMERIANPDLPARDILVDCHLVVRESCGAGLHRKVSRQF